MDFAKQILTLQGHCDLIDRYWKAARAAAALAELENGGPTAPAFVAILTEEQMDDLLAAPSRAGRRAR